MANGDEVSHKEQIVRYARPSDFDQGVLSGAAFDRPEKDYDGLSVCRLGIFSADLHEDLTSIRAALSDRMTLAKNGKLVQILVGEVVNVGKEAERALKVIEDALPETASARANPSHALIDGLPFKGDMMGSLSADLIGDLLRKKVSALHATS